MDRDEYLRRFPGYCKTCQGWGVHRTSSPEFRMWECGCVGANTCPRCGAQDGLVDLTCAKCQWDLDDKERGLPGSLTI